MNRRLFIGAIAGSALNVPRVADAQPAAKVYRIGFLASGTAEETVRLFRALDEGLRELGYVEGRNIVVEHRHADGRLERLPDLAAELVRLRVDVIVGGTNQTTAAAKRATATIPIVMTGAVDPVGAGFITNLARPGGNITGLTLDASAEIHAKYLGLLTEIFPRLSRVRVLRQADYGSLGFAQLEAAARHCRGEGLRASGAAADLRTEFAGSVPASRGLRREDSRRGQARRAAGRAARKVRAGDQPENRPGAQDHDPEGCSGAG